MYFCTAGGVFHAMSVKPLASVWKYGQKGQSEEIHAAAVTDKAVVLGTHDKRIVALDPATGDELWSVPLRVAGRELAGDRRRSGARRHDPRPVPRDRPEDGQEAWQTDVGGRFTASPAVSDGRIVIGNDDGVLYCIGSRESARESRE